MSEPVVPVPLSAADIGRLAEGLNALARSYGYIGRDTAPIDELLGRLRVAHLAARGVAKSAPTGGREIRSTAGDGAPDRERVEQFNDSAIEA